ncbi:tRNA pseudouridine13 synthase [Marinobacter daqiaonensis]|uniref:tRNA pseudouridine synthase D n=1 Tax=Marinobacter daqiaonensis TaxID=650891 RepID=A0A1I6GFH0_9GAMM|nr:tRNA pseudouridine(13) synthase TruD [Marinobacter daqiaonensis]SFR40944.1 tRNA pseudouridine13 synthase [Marinobacter daqiaonensis]
MSSWRLSWPSALGEQTGSGVLKRFPEDFRVHEQWSDTDPVASVSAGEITDVPGAGEHLLLYVEKTGDNTPWVARQLGEMAGCGEAGIGYCGLKDRQAVTRQWFSVQRPGREGEDVEFVRAVHSQWPVLAVARRSRKLRRGEHSANEFEIRIRELQGVGERIQAHLELMARHGCPNYFGSQRFGHDGANLDRAIAMSRRPRDRGRRRKSSGAREGMYFSAARSWLFNEVLAARVLDGSWRQRLEGEPDPQQATGPLWGDGGTVATGGQGRLEREVVGGYPAMEAVFASTRMAPERRELVLRPDGLNWQFVECDGETTLDIRFSLPPGQYATTMLSSVLDLRETDEGA